MLNTIDLDLYPPPPELIISKLNWRYLVRSVLRGKNIMMVGGSGSAKTMSARCVAEALGRPFFKINMGSTDDARATLIGNTTYKREIGTMFHKSSFVDAITTPNTIVLLDELTRGTHSAWNIIMTVIDPTQKYLRLDENERGDIIKVADGVCFICTCNVGNEYTATKVLDKALSRRFPIKLEMPALTGKELNHLFDIIFPNRTKEEMNLMKTLSKISDDLIAQCKLEDAPISTFISCANVREMCELVMDGFSLEEIAEAAIFPEYPDDGGADSERSFCKSLCQKYFSKDVKSPINDPLEGKRTEDF